MALVVGTGDSGADKAADRNKAEETPTAQDDVVAVRGALLETEHSLKWQPPSLSISLMILFRLVLGIRLWSCYS